MSTGNSSPPNQPTIIVRQGGLFTRLVNWLGWFGFGTCALALISNAGRYHDYLDTSGGIQEKFVSGSETSDKKVAILNIEGVIGEGEGYVKHQIDRIRKDKNVRAVVVRVDSPGGTISGSDYMLHHLKELKKERKIPVVVSMGAIAASGGYYVSMAVGEDEDTIFAEPTTTTGSIGVIVPHYDISGFLANWNIKDDSVASHPRKQMMAMTKPVSDEDRRLVKEYIDEAFQRFKAIVLDGRPKLKANPSQLDVIATGEIFAAPKAQKLGLVDKLGFVDDAIARAKEMASITGDVRVVRYERRGALLDLGAIGFASAEKNANPLGLFAELGTPKAYYMATTIPMPLSSYARQANN